jgi:hypothetical protein
VEAERGENGRDQDDFRELYTRRAEMCGWCGVAAGDNFQNKKY